MEGKYWSLIGLCGIVALLCMGDKKANSMSGIKKRRSRRLYYIYEGKTITREQVDEAKRLAKAGYGTLYATWAYSANEAREYIKQGRAERVSGLGDLDKEAWQMTAEEYYDTNLRFKKEMDVLKKLKDRITDIEFDRMQGFSRRFDVIYYHPNKDQVNLVSEYEQLMKSLQSKIRKIEQTPHSKVILRAINQGNPVPERVLKEYPELKKNIIPESKGQMTLFGGLGYKGYDEEGAINATIKNIEKFQGKPAFVYATYTGIKSTHIKPPYGQQYYRVNSDGSVDFVKYSKGITTEERIRNPKYKATEAKKKEQIMLFGGLGRLTPKERQKLDSFIRYNSSIKNLSEDRIKELALEDMGYRTYGDFFETKKEAEKIAKEIPNSTLIKEGTMYGIMYKPVQYMPIGYKVEPSFILHGLDVPTETKSDSLPPILGWVGGKTKLADKIISMMPPHKVYVEPFLGGGSVFFKKPLAEVNVINDLDKDLMNFYKGVRDGSCEKIRECKLPKNRKEFDMAVENKSKDVCSYLGVNKRAYGTKMTSLNFSTAIAKERGDRIGTVKFKEKCNSYRNKLKQSKMLNRNYKDVVKEFDSKDSLFYIDPPFVGTHDYGQKKIEPQDVAELVKSMTGKAIISYNDVPEVRRAFQGLKFQKANTSYIMQKSMTGTHKGVSELLITNF